MMKNKNDSGILKDNLESFFILRIYVLFLVRLWYNIFKRFLQHGGGRVGSEKERTETAQTGKLEECIEDFGGASGCDSGLDGIQCGWYISVP